MLRDRFKAALKEAMTARNELETGTLRMVLAAVKDRDIAARPSGNMDGISDPEILALLQSMIKQRQESAALYRQGNRQDLVDKEEGEIAILARFLPEQMSADEMEAALRSLVADLGATSIKDMGRAAAELRLRHAGALDLTVASARLKQLLSGG